MNHLTVIVQRRDCLACRRGRLDFQAAVLIGQPSFPLSFRLQQLSQDMLLGETDFVPDIEKDGWIVKVLILLVVNVDTRLRVDCSPPRLPVARDLNRGQKRLPDPRCWSR